MESLVEDGRARGGRSTENAGAHLQCAPSARSADRQARGPAARPAKREGRQAAAPDLGFSRGARKGALKERPYGVSRAWPSLQAGAQADRPRAAARAWGRGLRRGAPPVRPSARSADKPRGVAVRRRRTPGHGGPADRIVSRNAPSTLRPRGGRGISEDERSSFGGKGQRERGLFERAKRASSAAAGPSRRSGCGAFRRGMPRRRPPRRSPEPVPPAAAPQVARARPAGRNP